MEFYEGAELIPANNEPQSIAEIEDVFAVPTRFRIKPFNASAHIDDAFQSDWITRFQLLEWFGLDWKHLAGCLQSFKERAADCFGFVAWFAILDGVRADGDADKASPLNRVRDHVTPSGFA